MTTQELIEQAVLDALGLLDESEREDFDASFRAAPPSVQAQIRRQQTRFADLDLLLPDVEPPAGLRAAVIAAVREALAKTETEVTPVPMLQVSRRVAPVWRSAALALAAACVVFAVVTSEIRGGYKDILLALQRDKITDDLLKTLGPSFRDAFFDPDYSKVGFTTVGQTHTKSKAVLLFDPEKDEAILICYNLPVIDGKSYELVIINDDDSIGQRLVRFSASNRMIGQSVPIRLAIDARVALIGPDADNKDGPLLQSSRLIGTSL